jgi:hypothetical protein
VKKKSFHIAIDEPCAESWQNMQPNANGKFCMHCSKTVIDFTQQTSYEIKTYFQQHENTCGRFTKQQLNETYTIYEASKFDHYKFVASLALGLLTLDTLNAFSIDGKDFKNEKDSVQIVRFIDNNNSLDSANIMRIGNKQENLITLKGTVIDSTTKEPMIGVNIFLPSNKNHATVTDLNGNFELKVENNFPIELEFNTNGISNVIKVNNPYTEVEVLFGKDAKFKLEQIWVISGGTQRTYILDHPSNIISCQEKKTIKKKRQHKH